MTESKGDSQERKNVKRFWNTLSNLFYLCFPFLFMQKSIFLIHM